MMQALDPRRADAGQPRTARERSGATIGVDALPLRTRLLRPVFDSPRSCQTSHPDCHALAIMANDRLTMSGALSVAYDDAANHWRGRDCFPNPSLRPNAI